MPFDSEPAAEVTARDRVMRLRDFLATLPDERFKMSNYITGDDGLGNWNTPVRERLSACGSAACIVGWASFLRAPMERFDEDVTADWLGLSDLAADTLFYPQGYIDLTFTPAQAAAVLDRYLETGEIDWSVAE